MPPVSMQLNRVGLSVFTHIIYLIELLALKVEYMFLLPPKMCYAYSLLIMTAWPNIMSEVSHIQKAHKLKIIPCFKHINQKWHTYEFSHGNQHT